MAPEPPKKKHKSNLAPAASAGVEVPGATSSAAKGGAAEETSNRAAEKEAPSKLDPNSAAAHFIEALKDPACMAALKEFVTKGAHEQTVAALKGEFVTKREHEQTVARLDQIAGVFEPATKFALFETAIYQFVDPDIQELPSSQDGLRYTGEKIKHAMACLCADVVRKLLAPMKYGKKDLSLPGLSVRKKGGKVQWSRSVSNTLVMRALQGLVAYITVVDGQTIVDNMDTDLRNVLTHNGGILDAIYKTPDGKKNGNGNGFSTTKANVKKYRQVIQGKVASTVKCDTRYENADQAVKAVFDAMKQKDILKDIIAGLTDMDHAEAEVIKQVNKILYTAKI